MLQGKTWELAKAIGHYYLRKHGGDYDKAAEALLHLHITNLQVYPSLIVISTGRPGLLIGRRGEDLDGLKKHLKEHHGFDQKVHVEEATQLLYDVMCPEPPGEGGSTPGEGGSTPGSGRGIDPTRTGALRTSGLVKGTVPMRKIKENGTEVIRENDTPPDVLEKVNRLLWKHKLEVVEIEEEGEEDYPFRIRVEPCLN